MRKMTDYQAKSIRWLLKEKYNFTNLQVEDFLQDRKSKNFDLLNDVQRILKGEPVDYVIGFKEFLGLKIDLSKKPLIPRVETEYWLEKVIKTTTQYNKKTLDVLDIFCGSGCIGLGVLKHIKNSHVTFADVSKSCIEQTKINLKINNFQSLKKEIPNQVGNDFGEGRGDEVGDEREARYKIVKSDIFRSINGKFDIIFANPPYVPNRYVAMSKDLFFEPQVSLKGGENGMKFIKPFLKQVKSYLKPKGLIYMEFGDNQKRAITEILNEFNFSNYTFKKDQYNEYRYLVIKV